MNKYYIPEINLRDIRNKIDIVKKLENKFNKQLTEDTIILSTNGYYKYDKDKLIKYKIIEKDSKIIEKFLKKYSLIGINCYHKKIGEVFSIPYESSCITIQKLKFNIGKSNNFLVFEKNNNKIIDVYFLSYKKINENNIFFSNDVSSFIEMLMCK